MALAAIRGDKTPPELARALPGAPEPDNAVEGPIARAAGDDSYLPIRRRQPEAAGTIKALHAKIGQLAMENDF